ncbi:MAG: electron transfer flavoprotein subunit beta/FixA family protein [Victivallaceae bacterium]
MRIIVCIKQVPETKSVKMDEKTGTVIRKGVQAIINPLDLYAIESALILKEKYGAETIALSMGPPQAVEALKEAMAMGINQAVLVSDKAFAGSDTWATAYILAAAIRKSGGGDLILCGERATDGDTGQVGPELAATLDLPVATYVNAIESIESGHCRVRRLVENGVEELNVQLPGVITVVKEVGEPRLPTLRGKLRAKAAEIKILTLAELDVDKKMIGLEGSPTRVVKIFRPQVTRNGKIVHVADEKQLAAATEEFFNFLHTRGVDLP